MELIQNVLYVMTQGAYLRRDHLVIQVEVEGNIRAAVPVHNLEAVVLFGNVMVSPFALETCAERGVPLTFLSEGGRLLARVDAPVSGNVLLRREQYRKADSLDLCLAVAKQLIAGKLQNTRTSLQRSARESIHPETLAAAAEAQAAAIRRLVEAPGLEELRGIEGAAAREYFASFTEMFKVDRGPFTLAGRSRRPALDRTNSLLSFLYSLLLADCTAALAGAGLDPFVGFLHADRPGKPSLALDLMEEFRSLLADRLVVTLVNRKQIQPDDFEIRPGGAVILLDEPRRRVVAAWRERKQDLVTHPLFDRQMTVGMLIHSQARVLARWIRGDIDDYVPCHLK